MTNQGLRPLSFYIGFVQARASFLLPMATFVPVKITSRVGKNGRMIQCPHCHHSERVWHFAWSALQCLGCDAMVDKLDYSMEAK